MIKLTKGPKPEILAANERAWTDEYVQGMAAGDLSDAKQHRYRHPDIKDALRAETSNKCAYCESKGSHVHPGETEHILPKSKRRDLVVAWDNLSFVCSECNRHKLDYYSETEPLVHPYTDEPSDHLLFVGPLVLHRDDKGLRTTKQVALSRTALVERRQERIGQLNLLVQQWLGTPDGPTKDFLKGEIAQYEASSAEYSATMSAFVQAAVG